MKGKIMRLIRNSCFAIAAFLIASSVRAQAPAQAPAAGAPGAQAGRTPRIGFPGSPTADGSRAVTDGGIKVAGWQGKIDAAEETAGMTINDEKLTQEGDGLHVTTGPATTYWKSDAKASGDYTVKATPFQMNGRGAPNDAVHKAAAPGQPVTQEVALSVKGGTVECSIKGTVVATYDKAALVTDGKQKSTDGS